MPTGTSPRHSRCAPLVTSTSISNSKVLPLKDTKRNFPRGPKLKNPPHNAGDVGLIPGQEINVPHAKEQLNPGAAAVRAWQLRPEAAQ